MTTTQHLRNAVEESQAVLASLSRMASNSAFFDTDSFILMRIGR